MSDFIPYEYRPRFAGPTQPMTVQPASSDQQTPSLEDVFAKVGTVGHISHSFKVSELPETAPLSVLDAAKVFLIFPGDIALQRCMFAWSKFKADQSIGATNLTVSIRQYKSFSASGIQELDLFPRKTWTRAEFGNAVILDPIAQCEPYTPIVASIRCVNGSSPPVTAFFEDVDLELWMTIHFLAGKTA